MIRRGVVVLLALLLLGACLSLITAQHRARSLFVDLERAQLQARQLEADMERWRIELGRLSQPALIEAAARGIGLRPIDASRTVLLPALAPGNGAGKP